MYSLKVMNQVQQFGNVFVMKLNKYFEGKFIVLVQDVIDYLLRGFVSTEATVTWESRECWLHSGHALRHFRRLFQ